MPTAGVVAVLGSAAVLGAIVGAAFYMAGDGVTAARAPLLVEPVDGRAFATQVIATMQAPSRPTPDRVREASARSSELVEDRLSICVEDTSGTLSQADEVPRQVGIAVGDLRGHPRARLLGTAANQTAIVGLGCPLPSKRLVMHALGEQSFTYPNVLSSRDITPFKVFLFIIPEDLLPLLFPGPASDPWYRRDTQQVLWPYGGHVGRTVSEAFHLTPAEFRDRDVLSTVLARAFGLMPPTMGPPGAAAIWATPTPSP